MTNKFKDFKVPDNFFRIFYLLLPSLIYLSVVLDKRPFVDFMVILTGICFISGLILRMCVSKKEHGFSSIFTPLSEKSRLLIYFEHLFWLFITCLAIISFAKIQIYTICFFIYAISKSFAYLVSKPFQGKKFYDVTIAESIAFLVIGLIAATFIASSFDLKPLSLIFIYMSLAIATLTDARKKLIKFDNSSLTLILFVAILTIFDGIWGVF